MNAKEITEAIGDRNPCHNKTDKWIDHESLSKYPNLFIYGDDGGDLFVSTPATEEELTKLADDHSNGITNCDFETSIYLIVLNGKRVKPKITLVDY